MGAPLGDMIREGVKPALMTAIEGEFQKNPVQASFSPTRVSRVAVAGSSGGGGTAAGAAAGAGGGKTSKGERHSSQLWMRLISSTQVNT